MRFFRSSDSYNFHYLNVPLFKSNSNDIAVAFNGSWKKRGHVSLNGIVSATSVENSNVVDIDIFSKHYRCPGKLKNEHISSCIANYSGKSGGIEVNGVKEIYNRSVRS